MPFHRGRSSRGGRILGFSSKNTSGRQALSTSSCTFDPSIPSLGSITLFSLDKEVNADLRVSSGASKSAARMPDRFTSEQEYITSMQAHAEREYFAGAHNALQSLAKQAAPSQFRARVLDVPERKFARLRVLPRESTNAQDLDVEEQQSLSKNLLKESVVLSLLLIRDCNPAVLSHARSQQLQLREFFYYFNCRHLFLQVEGLDKLLLVTAEEVTGNVCEIKVSCPGDAGPFLECHGQISFQSVAYVGSDIQRYRDAALVLHDAKLGRLPSGTCALMKQVMSPSANMPSLAGCFNPTSELCTDVVPANASQKQVVLNLQGGLEAIQGPPGTGKSTTIFHIVSNRVLSGRKVAITATRNQAINAVTEKLAHLSGGILVSGNAQRLCPEARQHTLKERVSRHPEVVWWIKMGNMISRLSRAVNGAISQGLSYAMPPLSTGTSKQGRPLRTISANLAIWQRVVQATIKQRILKSLEVKIKGRVISNPLLFMKNCLEERFQIWQTKISQHILPAVEAKAALEILDNTRAFLCTIDASARMTADLEKFKYELIVDTVIVDEAGCVPEFAIPQLLALQPSNLILLGDHKQLPCFSALEDRDLPGHSRSLMERMVICGVKVPMLCEQFRMAPQICMVVSDIFYGGNLQTADEMKVLPMDCKSLQWVDSLGTEEKHRRGGYYNVIEAEQAVQEGTQAFYRLRRLQGIASPTIFIMTLYNQQKYKMEALLKASLTVNQDIPEAAIKVLSVDQVQGSEADATVLSLVKTQPDLSDFFGDVRRACVALSRAKSLSIIVGNNSVFKLKNGSSSSSSSNEGVKLWQRIWQMYQ